MKKKKFSIHNMSVRSKLLTNSAVALCMLIILAVLSIVFFINTTDSQVENQEMYAKRQIALSDAYVSFNKVRVDVRDILYMYHDDKAAQQEKINSIKTEEGKIEENFNLFITYKDEYGSAVINEYNKVVESLTAYVQSAEHMVSLVQSGDIEAAQTELIESGPTTAASADEAFNNFMDEMDKEANQKEEDINNLVNIIVIIFIGICVVAFIIVAVLCLAIIRQITVPISKLSVASRKMAAGDVDVDCTKESDDDLGQLMDEFAKMVEATKLQVKVAEQVSMGDLTMSVSTRSDKDVLGKAIQKMISENNRNFGNIKESTQQVTIGAEQVASASQSLAQGSTEQASALEEVTASMAEIAERTKVNAAQASEADDLVRNVKSMATDGKSQMQSMISAMNDINQSSETISKIIKTIDNISFQTNILALNAAVEAARAGVHGKGFSVVAEEVRNLASKSAAAASETADIIEDSIQKVSHGAKLAEETEKSLNAIVDAIDKIVDLIDNIAVASNDQATAVSQIDQAIGQVSTVVQTNSATSEQCAAASEELSNQAANLRELISTYKLATGSKSSYGSSMDSSMSYDGGSSNYNEQIISLDGEFGKY